MLNSCCFVRVLLHAHGSHCAAHRVVPWSWSCLEQMLVAMMLPRYLHNTTDSRRITEESRPASIALSQALTIYFLQCET